MRVSLLTSTRQPAGTRQPTPRNTGPLYSLRATALANHAVRISESIIVCSHQSHASTHHWQFCATSSQQTCHSSEAPKSAPHGTALKAALTATWLVLLHTPPASSVAARFLHLHFLTMTTLVGGRKRLTYQLDSPFSTDLWYVGLAIALAPLTHCLHRPEITPEDQDTILELLCKYVSSLQRVQLPT